MMAEAGTQPASDLRCNLGNRAPIDLPGERPCIRFHTRTVETHARTNAAKKEGGSGTFQDFLLSGVSRRSVSNIFLFIFFARTKGSQCVDKILLGSPGSRIFNLMLIFEYLEAEVKFLDEHVFPSNSSNFKCHRK